MEKTNTDYRDTIEVKDLREERINLNNDIDVDHHEQRNWTNANNRHFITRLI
jgi:hypothetical protein